jgi:uncharacterized protein (TIGR04168 family)
MTYRIGVIGDLHAHFDEVDVAHFSDSDYDLLIFIGDLGGGSRESTLRVARTMAKLRKPALVMPGNNDTVDIDELAAELAHRSGMRRLGAIGRGEAASADDAMVRLCGFSSHRIVAAGREVTLIAGRPHSMGGAELSFADYMQQTYDVDSMSTSSARLRALVETTETRDVVFFSHNGPTGLGAEPEDMWGCDFKPGGGDWGDPDLAHAVDHARQRGHRVLAVVGGHMHLKTKSGEQRPWLKELDGVSYVNSARVPRIFSDSGDVWRHHISLVFDGDTVEIAEQLMR